MTAAIRASKKVIYILRNFLRLGPFSANMERRTGVHQLQVPLPGPDQFREVLAQEFAHTSNANFHLAVLLLRLSNWSVQRREDLARLLRATIRRDEVLFSVSESCFALLLRGKDADGGAFISLQLLNLLRRYFDDEFFSLNLLAYPEKVGSLSELEAEVTASIA